jgi:hypothetical protein
VTGPIITSVALGFGLPRVVIEVAAAMNVVVTGLVMKVITMRHVST